MFKENQILENNIEKEKFPEILYHGSRKKFFEFRIKGKKRKTIQVQGGKVIFLHENADVASRKYAKEGGYLYEVKVKKAKNYEQAIKDENLKVKKKALVKKVWVALAEDLEIKKIWKIEKDGFKKLIFEKE